MAPRPRAAATRFETERTVNISRSAFSHTRLSEVECFKGLSVDFMQALIGELDIELFQEGDMIMKEGEVGSNMIFLLHGSVYVMKGDEMIATLGEGSLFGEMVSLGLSSKRSCTIVASEFCDCRSIGVWHFRVLLNRFPEARAHFEHVAEERQSALREARRASEMESFLDRSRHRIAMRHKNILPGRRHSNLIALHDHRLTSTFRSKRRQSCPAVAVDHVERASLLAAGWKVYAEGDQPAGHESRTGKELAADGGNACEADEGDDDCGMVLRRFQPVAPASAAPGRRPGSKFRAGRWLKQDGDDCLESAATTAPSSRAASIVDFTNDSCEDSSLPTLPERRATSSTQAAPTAHSSRAASSADFVNASCEDSSLPSLPEPKVVSAQLQTPRSLKATMQSNNASLRMQLVKTRDELVQDRQCLKIRGIDLASLDMKLYISQVQSAR